MTSTTSPTASRQGGLLRRLMSGADTWTLWAFNPQRPLAYQRG